MKFGKIGTNKQNLGPIWESKVSPLDNIVQKQPLSESIQIWKFPLGEETHNDKHNWIKYYIIFFKYNLQCY